MKRRAIVLIVILALLAVTGMFSGVEPEPIELSEGSSVVGIQDVNVQDGRLLKYDFDIGENATLVPNRAGPNHEGQFRGNITHVSRDGGTAVQFNGTEGQILVENSSSFETQDGVTFAFWIKPDEAQKGNLFGDFNSYFFFIRGKTVNFVVVHNRTRIAQPTADVPIGEWSHVVGTYDPDQGARLFVNGELANSNTKASATINSTHVVGAYPTIRLNMGGWKSGYNGSIDEFSVWNKSLSKTDVQMVQQGRDQGLVFSPPLRIAMTLLLILLIVGFTVRDRVF